MLPTQNAFYNDFFVQPFTPRTKRIYSRIILDFFGGIKPSLSEVTNTKPADIQRYLGKMLCGGRSNATYNQALAALSAFFKFCYNSRIIDRTPTSLIKGLPRSKYSTTETIPQEGFKKMLQIIEENTNQLIRLRDKAILLVALLGALRRSEIANLTRGQLTIVGHKGEKYLVIHFKGKSKSRRRDEKIILDQRAWTALYEYLNAIELQIRSFDPDEPVFRSLTTGGNSYGKPLSDRSVYNIIHNYAKCAGYDNIGAHSIRHSSGTIAVENGLKDVKILQSNLRHADPRTTMEYIHNDDLFTHNLGRYIHV